MDFAAWPGNLEIRQVGGARELVGVFKYDTLATLRSSGRVRKETIASRAFSYAIQDETRKIDVLVGHDFGKPVANRQTGSLVIEDADDAVRFTATLPDDAPSWVVDMEKAVNARIMTGLSPGFQVPPRAVVANAEELIPEPGNPGVSIRRINAAVLREFSVVTSAAYEDAGVALRSEDMNASILIPRSVYQWL